MKHIKKESFIKGILILFASQMIIKLLGLVYRVVITNLDGFGDNGNSYYGAAYQIYTVILAIATVGIPSAMSKLVAEKVAVGNTKGAHKIYRTGLMLFISIGLAGSLLMAVFAPAMAKYVQNPGLEYSLWALSPSVLLVAISSVIRGYFQGYCNMKPQAVSQVIDQIVKCVFTILLAMAFVGQDAKIMAAAATLGATIGTTVSMFYLIFYYGFKHKELKQLIAESENDEVEERRKVIIKRIISLSIPISFGAVITSMAGMVNLLTVIPRLLTIPGMTEESARAMYGIISGKSDTLLNLPLAINIAFATSLVPNISAAFAVNDKKGAAKKIGFSIFSTILIVLPAAVGISVLSDPLIKMLFHNAPEGGFYLAVSSYAVIFMALSQTLNGSLQGMGKVYIPAIAIITGAVIKYISNYILVAIPEINMMGAAYSTIICYFVAAMISFVALNRHIKLELSFSKYVLKPIVAVTGMGVATYYSYNTLLGIVNSNTISTLASICIAIVVYGFMLLALDIFNREELERIPVINKFLVK